MKKVYLSLGANLGERAETIREALRRLAMAEGTELLQVAPFYETAPWGKTDQPGFINTCAEVRTSLCPTDFLHLCQGIEQDLGRVRHEHWGARTIDIDMLWMEGVEADTEELRLPHPYLIERAFVLVPLADIAPKLMVKGRTVKGWLMGLDRQGQEVSPAAEINEPFPLRLIACIDEDRGLGRAGHLLASLPEDMARFRSLTMGGILVMGRKTMESLPRALEGRGNLVLSRSCQEVPKGFELLDGLPSLWRRLGQLWQEKGCPLWCIGGGEIYRLLLPYTGEAYLTCLPHRYGADVFLPELQGFALAEREAGKSCVFEHYVRRF